MLGMALAGSRTRPHSTPLRGRTVLTSRTFAGGRAQVVRVASECMGTAANPAKGGFVREALINQYPKLAGLLEDTLHKIRRDTEVWLATALAGPVVCTLNVSAH